MATPQIIAFTADPATVAPGERVTLTAVARIRKSASSQAGFGR